MIGRDSMLAGNSRLSLGLLYMLSLSSCGIYGDWFTDLALNHSEQTVIVTASKGSNAGKNYVIGSGKGLMVPDGSFSSYLTISIDAPVRKTLFDGHVCEGDWILNGNDAVLVIDPAFRVSCVRLKDLRSGSH